MAAGQVMISSVVWVPRGAAAADPQVYEPSQEELDILKKMANSSLDDDEEEEEPGDEKEESAATNGAKETGGMETVADKEEEETEDKAEDLDDGGGKPADASTEAFMKSLNMENYDHEPEGASMFLGGHGLSYHKDNAEDPYITLPDDQDDSDAEDFTIKPQDAIILAARTEEDHNSLEVYVYEDSSCNLFVHHDFVLPAFPLSLAWMNLDPRTKDVSSADRGNFVAVSSFRPEIEIWNLDVMDVMEPVAILGGLVEEQDTVSSSAAATELEMEAPFPLNKEKKKKKKKKAQQAAADNRFKAASPPQFKPGSHTDSVLSLAWNAAQRNCLASGSADNTVKLWDLCTQQCTVTLQHHKSKVQALAWNPVEAYMLLTGSYDQHAAVLDARAPANTVLFHVKSDVESISWNPSTPLFGVSSENGYITLFDVRSNAAPYLTIASRNNKAVTSIAFNPIIPNFLAAGSLDKSITLWDVSDHQAVNLANKQMAIGSVFSLAFYGDAQSPFLLATGGSKGTLAIWDTLEVAAVRRAYGSKFAQKSDYETYETAAQAEMAKEAAELAEQQRANASTSRSVSSKGGSSSSSSSSNSSSGKKKKNKNKK